MGTKQHGKAVHHRKGTHQGQRSLVAFLVVGLVSDVLTLLGWVVKAIRWPAQKVSLAICQQFKHHPFMRYKHSHAIINVGIGALLLLGTCIVQHWFQHPAWEAGVEIGRAGAVCPIWEAIAATLRAGKDIA